jgi:Fic family protein
MTVDDPGDGRRHSRALDPQLVDDPQRLAEAEAANGLRQFDLGVAIIQESIERRQFRLRLSTILVLHREALSGISSYAGNFRPGGVEIAGSRHEPVAAHLVPGLMEELCDYVNDHWQQSSPIHLAAYVMWRLNWIHPFADGNGRTSRILSYVVMCARLGLVLPGLPTIPEQIQADREPYFAALDAADDAWRAETINVELMEQLIEGLLAHQLMAVFQAAKGKPGSVDTE